MIVVKVGGGTSLDVDAVVADIVALRAKGTELLLVHGGAQTTNAVAEALGHPPEFVTSETGHVSRRTDRRTLEIFEMVYCGQLNKMWVEKLQRQGVNAVGLSGLDGRIFEGTRKDTLRIRVDGRRMVLRDDWTGTVERVNTALLRLLIGAGYFPVLTPPGASTAGEAINVDGDRAAAMVAGALKAEALVILTDTPGLLRTLPRRVHADHARFREAEADRFMDVRRRTHEEEGDGRGRSDRRRRRQGDLRRRPHRRADYARARRRRHAHRLIEREQGEAGRNGQDEPTQTTGSDRRTDPRRHHRAPRRRGVRAR